MEEMNSLLLFLVVFHHDNDLAIFIFQCCVGLSRILDSIDKLDCMCFGTPLVSNINITTNVQTHSKKKE